jgi:hypothetical protein
VYVYFFKQGWGCKGQALGKPFLQPGVLPYNMTSKASRTQQRKLQTKPLCKGKSTNKFCLCAIYPKKFPTFA